MSYTDALQAIGGVRYVVEISEKRVRIVLNHNAPFETVDEIRDVKPVGLELRSWGATQEHFPAIECRMREVIE